MVLEVVLTEKRKTLFLRILKLIDKRMEKAPNYEEVKKVIKQLSKCVKKEDIIGFYAKLRANEILFFNDLRPEFAIPEEERRKPTRILWEQLLYLSTKSIRRVP